VIEVLHRPAWSPDGSYLAFDHRDGREREVWIVGVDYIRELLKKARPQTP